MVKKRKITRREFLRVSALAAAGGVAAACAGPMPVPTEEAPAPEETEEPEPEEPEEPAAEVPETKFNEAPMLAELVASGDLPPVDERLPENPLVLEGMEGLIGNYGGTMRRGFKGVSDRWGPTKMVRQGLLEYTPELDMRPNIAESWEANADASVWTFHLRKGMKWSDGEPFDAGCFQWWYENVLLNETLTPSVPGSWSTGDPRVLMEMEFPDEYTVVIKFADPNPLFLYTAVGEPFTPGHYMQQFHAETTDDPEALEQTLEENNMASWDLYYWDRDAWYLNPERPSVYSFVPQNALSEELFIMERNPYFFQVDPEGNQLPYMDTMTHRLFNSPEVFNMWIINGEIDYQQRHVSVGDYSLLKENEANGDYRVQPAVLDDHTVLSTNMTSKKPRVRELFQSREVRIAISLAVNREEINELVFNGLTTPRQYSPLEESPQYYPKLSDAYIEYDPEQANALMDEAGYTEKDDEGFRLWKDGSGEQLSFIIEGTATAGSPDEDAVQMIITYLADIGIKASYKSVERSLYEEHWAANEVDAGYWGCGRSLVPIVDPAFFLGTGLDRPWAEAWGRWRVDPEHPSAEEPPADHWIRTIWEIWDQIELEPDEDTRTEMFFQILDIWAEEIPQPGFLGEKRSPIIVKNGMRNLSPDYVYPLSNPTKHGGLVPLQTYFWEDPENHT
jgi:peptide/nickel transport system substrate-binding protein